MPKVLSVLTLLTVLATPVFAQVPAAYEHSSAGSIGSFAERPDGQHVSTQRDSLLNGVLIGAGTGAMLGLAFGVSREDACRACAGFNQPLTYGVIFGGVGAAVGAGIDALFYRALPSAPSARHIRVRPMLTKEVRGISGSLRF